MQGTSTPPRVSKDALLAFDLNDISREPSDEQLAALMEAVVAEARRHAQQAQAEYAHRLQVSMAEAQRTGASD